MTTAEKQEKQIEALKEIAGRSPLVPEPPPVDPIIAATKLAETAAETARAAAAAASAASLTASSILSKIEELLGVERSNHQTLEEIKLLLSNK